MTSASLRSLLLRRSPISGRVFVSTTYFSSRYWASTVSTTSAETLNATTTTSPTYISPPSPPPLLLSIPTTFWKDLEEASTFQPNKRERPYDTLRQVVKQYHKYLMQIEKLTIADRDQLLQPQTVSIALKCLSYVDWKTPKDLGEALLGWERQLGLYKQTPLHDRLSLRLLALHSKAGHVHRCIQLLQVRASKQYPVREREIDFFCNALRVQSQLHTASANAQFGLDFGTRSFPNVFFNKHHASAVDIPTRWLDLLLLNLQQRKYPLTTPIANRLLDCYKGHGYTGRSSHHFWSVKRRVVVDENDNDDMKETSGRPRLSCYDNTQHTHVHGPTKIELQYNSHQPPYYKVPSLASQQTDAIQPKSNAVQAAWQFAESLQQGACGHAPIVLDVESYNVLLNVCVYRGDLNYARHVLTKILPKQLDGNGNNDPLATTPNRRSYNHVLRGLSRVGDVAAMHELVTQMVTFYDIHPDEYTLKYMVQAMLNHANVTDAISYIQDSFNQYKVVPPIATHCHVLEVCLGLDLVYEAKRYVYFIQQLWHWKATEYDAPRTIRQLQRVQNHPQLQKEALQRLFAYFGYPLDESDFL